MKANRYSTIILLTLFFSLNKNATAQSPDWLWAKTAGGSNFDYLLHSATDANGNSYITGFFNSDSITFGTTTLVNYMTDGSQDIFIVKYNAAGNVVWAKSAGGNSGDWTYGIAADNSGNSYITGAFQSDSVTFDNVTIIDSSSGYGTYFLVKYDPAGNVLWATHTYGGSGFGIAPDANGNTYVTGRFQIPTITFGSTGLTTAGLVDIFTVKYDSSGHVLWAKSAGGNNTDWSNGIAIDSNGNCYVTGGFNSSSINFDGTTLINASACTYCTDMFIVKYDATGNVIWANNAGGANPDNGVGITADANGNSYVTGYFMSDSIIFGNTTLINATTDESNDIFIVKYDTGGNVVWANSAGSDTIDIGQSIAADAYGNCYLTGYFTSDSISFGNTTLINTNTGTADLFVAGYDSSGNIVWAKSAGGNDNDLGIGIGIDASGGGYITGWYQSASIDFGNTTLLNINEGHADIYLAKFDIATGIENEVNKNGISIFPNPSPGIIHISFERMIRSGKVEVLNLLGESSFSETISNESKKEINLQGISNGIYFVKVYGGEKSYCRKLIVE